MKKKEAKVAAKKVKKAVKKTVPAKKVKKVIKAIPKAKAKVKAKAPLKTAKKPLAKKASLKKKASSQKTVVKKTAAKKTSTPKKVKATVQMKAQKQVFQSAKPAVKRATSLQNFITPLDDRILVRLTEAAKVTPGGLYIPDTVKSVTGNVQGQVVSVGRGHLGKKGHVRPLDVKLGDSVVFSEYAGSKIEIQNEDLIILRESDVMGVVAK